MTLRLAVALAIVWGLAFLRLLQGDAGGGAAFGLLALALTASWARGDADEERRRAKTPRVARYDPSRMVR